MFANFENTNLTKPFTISNGMILLEIMNQKKKKFDDLFTILGPRSLILEIINGKRKLTINQIKKLSEYFEMSSDIFLIDENQPNSASSHFENQELEQNPFSNPEDQNRDNLESSDSDNENSNSHLENSFEQNDSSHYPMKPFWED
ncbi:hypothetical protein [Silvanigrella sp.]|jgi:plasmid maintenance system antidote protein VapI|uniref:hypothetical protein n=1 Tax=Silvanigrella sp. TaxID=2024976 RepID=UPI0037C6CA5D